MCACVCVNYSSHEHSLDKSRILIFQNEMKKNTFSFLFINFKICRMMLINNRNGIIVVNNNTLMTNKSEKAYKKILK